MRKVLATVTVLIVFLVSGSKGQEQEDEIVAKFLSQETTPVMEYTSIRHIEARNLKTNMSASMEVEVNLSGNGKRLFYRVINESGSGIIRNKAIRKSLNDERTYTEKIDPSKVAFTPSNYTITAGEEVFPDLFQLLSKPLRNEPLMIDGSLFVTPTGDLVRIEGRLVKNPSWWTNDVKFVRVYSKIEGARLPVFLESTAQVKLVGPSSMTVTYHYLSVNGVAVTETR
ncbi:MAG: hypothetical protein AB201_02940 [Parcubacteria bacterium C7867-006]|nr:MAG: hypothetical protein AB201_02940 [Parcubacteria bacterium C7867-006]